MDTYWKRIGKNYPVQMKPTFLLLALLWCSVQMEKAASVAISPNFFFMCKLCFNSLNIIASTLFTFALAVTMPQVSGSDLH